MVLKRFNCGNSSIKRWLVGWAPFWKKSRLLLRCLSRSFPAQCLLKRNARGQREFIQLENPSELGMHYRTATMNPKKLTRQRPLRPKASIHTNTNCYCIKIPNGIQQKKSGNILSDAPFNSILGEINHSIPGSCGSSALVYHQLSFQKRDQHRLTEQNIAIIRKYPA